MKTVLFVGAGRHQRNAILRAKELGLRVLAADRNEDALGLAEADVPFVVDFSDVEAVLAAVADVEFDGVLTVSADRAVPVVAAVAEARGLPGIGTATAHLMTHKVAMRRRLAEDGVPQPRFSALRILSERYRAAEEVGFPAVLKPADSGGQRGIFVVRSVGEIEAHLHEAVSASPTREAILEEYVEGMEIDGIVIARGGEAETLTLSGRRRPPGSGSASAGSTCIRRRCPATNSLEVGADGLAVLGRSASAIGSRFPQLIAATDGRMVVVEVAARIPGGEMSDLVRHAVSVDLVEGAVADGARRGATRFARQAGLPPATRNPLPDRGARATHPGTGHPGRIAREGTCLPGRRPGGHLSRRWRGDPAGAARRRRREFT